MKFTNLLNIIEDHNIHVLIRDLLIHNTVNHLIETLFTEGHRNIMYIILEKVDINEKYIGRTRNIEECNIYSQWKLITTNITMTKS